MSSDGLGASGSEAMDDGEAWSDGGDSYGFSDGSDDVRKQVEQERAAVDTMTSTCDVTDSEARAILEAFSWDYNEACMAYLEDAPATRLKAGILDLANGPLAHDTEGTVWRSLWMSESGNGMQPYSWDHQWQLLEAQRRDPGGRCRLLSGRQLGQRGAGAGAAGVVVDLAGMVEAATGRKVQNVRLENMPGSIQDLVEQLKCHPLAAYNLLERCGVSPHGARHGEDRAKELWRRLGREFEASKTPESEVVDGSLFSAEAQKRLVRELAEIKGAGRDIEVDLVEDRLGHWEICVYKEAFDKDCGLYKDMTVLPTMLPGAQSHLVFEALFDAQYPASPPFIFLKSPRMQVHSGHVALNGAICLELLANTGTPTGYSADYSVNSLFRLVLTNMIEPSDHAVFTAARVDFAIDRGVSYSAAAARQDFERVARMHGWNTRRR
ncbi:unnamed protein product [Ostreobium quekettii]|uniref:UBC core domain-containing protein n=1 Tax=Ostreobium quekettii TaxID=121088 RepID=A0A8S1IUV3_9CHLO|nr:unnamed protein product [Ostreobium quekettii]|eukprot:evm.model.scf_716.2 EVM.evm.TU.scf_716.2   scf_716:5174-11306(+)